MPGPTDATSAVIVDGGKLLVIDGRGTPWFFMPANVKPLKGEKEARCPKGFKQAWAGSDRLGVIDSEDTAWGYNFSTGLWTKGPKVEVIETDPPSEAPWQAGPVLAPVAIEEEAA